MKLGSFQIGPKAGMIAGITLAIVFLVFPDSIADLFSNSSSKKNIESLALVDGKPLTAFETLHLQSGEDRKLDFKSGYSIKLIGPAEAFVEKWNRENPDSPMLLHILSGDFELLQGGTAGQLYVLKDRQMVSPEKKTEPSPKVLTIEQRTDVSPTQPELVEPVADTTESDAPKTEGGSGPTATLDNDFINDKISAERNQFIRCQSNSMRDGKTSAGNIMVAFVITQRGQTDQVRVLQSTLNNPEFESCVVSVFQRITFKAFTGPAITRSFPLTFE